MAENFNGILTGHARATMLYYKQVEFAARIKQCGVPDLVPLVYNSGKVSLEDAASICDSPPEIQRAACDIVRFHEELFSLRDAVGAIDSAREANEWETLDPFSIQPRIDTPVHTRL